MLRRWLAAAAVVAWIERPDGVLDATAHALSPDAEALKLLDRGIRLYDRGELAAAHDAFAAARALVPERANPYRWLGLVEARQGDCEHAVASLEEFIRRTPPIDPRVVEATTVRDRCRGELAPHVGTLLVATTPPGASVWIDRGEGAPAGVTPLKVPSLAEGAHVLFLRKGGYAEAARPFTVRRGETVRFELTLATPTAVAVAPVAAPPSSPPAPAATPAAPAAPAALILAPAPSTSEAPSVERPRRWPWVVLGVGAAVLVAGGIAAGVAVSAEGASGASPHPGVPVVDYPSAGAGSR